MTLEYVFKLKPGASLQYERKNPLVYNKYSDGFDAEQQVNHLTLEGDVLDSSRSIASGISLNGATEYDIEVTVKVTRKFEPGYYRRNLRHPHNHESAAWFEKPPWRLMNNKESDWERVKVLPNAT